MLKLGTLFHTSKGRFSRPSSDLAAVAVTAAGIDVTLRVCQIADHDGGAQLDWLTIQFEGSGGVMVQVAEASETMERIGAMHGVPTK